MIIKFNPAEKEKFEADLRVAYDEHCEAEKLLNKFKRHEPITDLDDAEALDSYYYRISEVCARTMMFMESLQRRNVDKGLPMEELHMLLEILKYNPFSMTEPAIAANEKIFTNIEKSISKSIEGKENILRIKTEKLMMMDSMPHLNRNALESRLDIEERCDKMLINVDNFVESKTKYYRDHIKFLKQYAATQFAKAFLFE